MSDNVGSQIGSLSKNLKGTRNEISHIRSGQAALEEWVKKLEQRKSEDVRRFQDTRSNHCEPFQLVLVNFPEVLEELLRGSIVDLGAWVDGGFKMDHVKSTGRVKPRAPQGISSAPIPPPDSNVKFTSAELRNAFLKNMRGAKGVDGALTSIHEATPLNLG